MEKSIRRRRSGSCPVLALVGALVLSGQAPSAQSRKLSAPLQRLPGEVPGHWLTPDGEWCVFLANPEIQAPSLFLVSLEQPDQPLEIGAAPGGITSEGVRLSRDGARIAFTASGDLYGLSLHGGGAPVLVAGVSVDGAGVGDRHHELSPDGNRVVFWARRGFGPFELRTASLDGAGSHVVLSAALSTDPVPPTFAITPDSTRVVYTLDQDSAGAYELYSVPIDGSARPTKLGGVLASDRDVQAFRITADGTRVVYTSDVESNDVFELYIAAIDGSAAPLKLSGPLVARGSVSNIELLPNERVLYRADATVDERHELFSAPLDGSTPPALLNAPLAARGDVDSFRATADGTRVVYVAWHATDAARMLHLAPTDGSGTPFRLESPPIAGSDVSAFRLSPDGAHAVHLSLGLAGTSELYAVPLAASAAAVRLALSASYNSFEISPDGARVVYRTSSKYPAPPLLASVPIDGSLAPIELGPASHFVQEVFTIAADSRSVFFRASPERLGAIELYRAPLDGSKAAERLCMPLLPGPVAGDAGLVGIGAGGEHAVYDVEVRGPRYSLPGEVWTVNRSGTPAPLRVFADGNNEGKLTTLDPSGEFVVTRTFMNDGTLSELWSGAADGSRPSARLGKPGTRSGLSVEAFDVSASGEFAFTTYDQLFAGSLAGSPRPLPLSGPIGTSKVMSDVQLEPGGARAVYCTYDFGRSAYELLSVPTDGSAAPIRLLSAALHHLGVESYRISPRGGRVVYVADQDRKDVFELHSVPIDGSAAPVKLSGTLASDVDVSADFVLTPDGARVVYVVGGALSGLFSVPIDGSAVPVDLSLPPVPDPPAVVDLRITPDGKRVIFLTDLEGDRTLDLFSTGVSAGPARRLNAPLAPGGSVQMDYQLGPAGRRVVYRADQDSDEVFELYMVPADGRRAPIKLNAPLSPDADVHEAFVISPDGTRAVFAADARVDDVVELFAVPLHGGVSPRLLHPPLRANADIVARTQASLAITPDSRHVVYAADADTDEVFELFESALPPTRRGARQR